jgi:hypothetical protein
MRLQRELSSQRSQAVYHMQRALFEMNVQLSNVISYIAGETVLRIIKPTIAQQGSAPSAWQKGIALPVVLVRLGINGSAAQMDGSDAG